MGTITRANLVGQPLVTPGDSTIPRPAADACQPVNGETPRTAKAQSSVGEDGWNVDLTAHYLCDSFGQVGGLYEVKRDVEGPAERYTEIVHDRNQDGFIDSQSTTELVSRDLYGGTLRTEQLLDQNFDRQSELDLAAESRLFVPIRG